MLVFKNRFGEFRSGWSVALAMILILLGQGIAQALVPDGKEDDIFTIITTTFVYGLLVIGGGILIFCFIYKRKPHHMGLYKKGCVAESLYGFLLGAVSMGLVFAALVLCDQANIVGINVDKLLSVGIAVELFSVCLFAFSEELITRGYIMTALKTTRNKWVIFLASSVTFSLAHLMNPGITILSLINTFLAGLLFAYMFIKSGKIWLPAGFHIAWNFVGGDILGMRVSGNEQAAIITVQLGDNVLLTGGAYGHEGGLLVTAVLVLAFLYTHFVIKTPSYPIWTMDSDLPLIRGDDSYEYTAQ